MKLSVVRVYDAPPRARFNSCAGGSRVSGGVYTLEHAPGCGWSLFDPTVTHSVTLVLFLNISEHAGCEPGLGWGLRFGFHTLPAPRAGGFWYEQVGKSYLVDHILPARG